MRPYGLRGQSRYPTRITAGKSSNIGTNIGETSNNLVGSKTKIQNNWVNQEISLGET